MHWPLPRKLGPLTPKELLFSRLLSRLMPQPYYDAWEDEGLLASAGRRAAAPFKRLIWRAMEWAIRREFEMEGVRSDHKIRSWDLGLECG